MIAAIYARKSTDDSERNEDARSTTRQVERATEYAIAMGWTVDHRHVYVDDAVSGAEWKHRPGFNALLAACKPQPPFGVLIVSELSRIGRDTVRTPYAVQQTEESGVGRLCRRDRAYERGDRRRRVLVLAILSALTSGATRRFSAAETRRSLHDRASHAGDCRNSGRM